MEQRATCRISAAALLIALGLGAGCSSHASSTSTTTKASTRPAPSTSAAPTTSPVPTTSTPATTTGPIVSVALADLPASIKRGSAPVSFRIVLSNAGDTDAIGVAPLFQLVGPPCNCVAGTLERRAPSTGAWTPAPLPEGDGYDPLERAEGPVTVPAHGSVSIEERITVSAANNPKAATALGYAVNLADHRQLGPVSSLRVEITR